MPVTDPDASAVRMRCCICASDDMDFAIDYVELTLRVDFSPAEQRFGAHAACLATVLAPGFRVEIVD